MAKNRGLPSSFNLDVPAAVLTGPVNLGDYLDEEDIAPAARAVRPARQLNEPAKAPAPPAEPPKVLAMPRHTAPPMSRPVPSAPVTFQEPVPASRAVSKPVSRKQLNMNPETLKMVEELLSYIQNYSVQKDAKASEMFHGLVAALYDARELIALGQVPPRGRWGTPTAHAFPIALKNAFQSAIAEWQRRHSA